MITSRAGIIKHLFEYVKMPSYFCTMNHETPPTLQKDYAKLLFTNFDMSIQDIANITETDEATVRNWIKTGSWNDLKSTLLTSKQNELQFLYALLNSISGKRNSGELSSKDLDTYLKCSAAIKNLEVEASISQIVDTGMLFITWLRRRNNDLAKTFTMHWDTFIKQRLNPLTE